jgi:hypothetical protein
MASLPSTTAGTSTSPPATQLNSTPPAKRESVALAGQKNNSDKEMSSFKRIAAHAQYGYKSVKPLETLQETAKGVKNLFTPKKIQATAGGQDQKDISPEKMALKAGQLYGNYELVKNVATGIGIAAVGSKILSSFSKPSVKDVLHLQPILRGFVSGRVDIEKAQKALSKAEKAVSHFGKDKLNTNSFSAQSGTKNPYAIYKQSSEILQRKIHELKENRYIHKSAYTNQNGHTVLLNANKNRMMLMPPKWGIEELKENSVVFDTHGAIQSVTKKDSSFRYNNTTTIPKNTEYTSLSLPGGQTYSIYKSSLTSGENPAILQRKYQAGEKIPDIALQSDNLNSLSKGNYITFENRERNSGYSLNDTLNGRVGLTEFDASNNIVGLNTKIAGKSIVCMACQVIQPKHRITPGMKETRWAHTNTGPGFVLIPQRTSNKVDSAAKNKFDLFFRYDQ